MFRSRAWLLGALLLVVGLSSFANAHPEGFSGLRVDVQPERVVAVATIHTRDTSAWFPPGKFPDYVPQVTAALAAAPTDVLEIRFDEQPAEPTSVRAFEVETGLLQVELTYPRPAGAQGMQVWSKHLIRLPRGHQQLLFVEAGGATLLQDTLDVEHDAAEVDLPRGPTTVATAAPARSRISFFLLGVEHIVTGYDHLLFLAALLLVCRNFKEAAAVITFFTVAHSITLTLAVLDIVRLPSNIVEPAIAASIVYVGLENVFGRHRLLWRAMITFGFGLVHGLGFASALREVGLGSTSVGVAWPLVKFSAGLETGQLVIAAVILQLLFALRRQERYERQWVPACSVLVSLIGGYWLVTRLISG